MYQNKITLTPQEILEKDFKIDTRGYRLKEVDEFLDMIKQELRNVSMDAEIAKNSKSDTMEITNLDILRRLSNLEKAVFGKDSE